MKKLTVGMCFAAVTAVLSIASLLGYNWNIGSAGYFQNAAVSNLVMYCAIAAVGLIAAIALAQVKVSGAAGTAVELVIGALQILAPALLALCLINLIAARAEGLGFIYFSNADVIVEVQTPENLASATGSIANMVCLGITTVVGIITAFINIKKSA